MRIAYFCDEYPPAPHGGIGTFTHTIAHAMADAGHEVTVVGFGQKPAESYDGRVRVVQIGTRRVPRLRWLLNRLALHRWLAAEVASRRIDIIEVPEFAGTLPLPFNRCPVVVRLHLSATAIARTAGRRPNWAVYLCEYATLRHHRNWIAVSKHSLDLTKQTFHLQPVASTVIYNPITLAAADSHAVAIDLPERFVLYAGTVSRRKGAYLLALSARCFLGEEPSTHLVYAGPLSADHGLDPQAEIIRRVGPELAHRVHFLGRLDRATLAQVMRRATAFAFPSALESFALVVGEAMLSGVPVVVPDAPPFDEFVTNGELGFLVPPGDPEALGAKILALLRSPELRRVVGDRAKSEVRDRFSVERCLIASTEVYGRLAARAHVHGARF